MNAAVALGRLYQLNAYSKPRFILGASPFVAPGDEQLLVALRQVVRQQEHMASKLATAIDNYGRPLPKGTYPTRYASLHNLELRYLLSRVVGEQRLIVDYVSELCRELEQEEAAQRLALEVRRSEATHLRLLEELSRHFPPEGRHQVAEGNRNIDRQRFSLSLEAPRTGWASATKTRNSESTPMSLAS